MAKMAPRDLYNLRKAQLHAEHKGLVALMARHSLKRLSLELERKYNLLTRNVQLDVNTGDITQAETLANGEER